MSQYNQPVGGYYTSDALAKTINLPYLPDWIDVEVQGNSSGDNWTSSANPGVIKTASWRRGMADGAALATVNTNSAATDAKAFYTSNGFSLVTPMSGTFGAPLTVTSINQANPAVVALASTTGLATGDTILLTGSTGQLQIAGLPFTIGTVVANTSFPLAYLSSSGFAAAASAGTVKKILYPNIFLPKLRYITAVTKAASGAVVTFSTTHGFSVGMSLRFHCNADFGMTQIDGLAGKITAVNTSTNTVTVDIDSSAFTTFAYPTSAVAATGTTFPHAVPIGDQASSFDGSFSNTASYAVILGTSVVGATSALVLWRAGQYQRLYTS